MKTIAIMEIIAIVAKAPKVFKKVAIITIDKKTSIVEARAFKKNNTTDFNKRKIYIQINSNTAIFAWRRKKKC